MQWLLKFKIYFLIHSKQCDVRNFLNAYTYFELNYGLVLGVQSYITNLMGCSNICDNLAREFWLLE